MATLTAAQTGSAITTNPITTLLSHLSGANWTATPAATAIYFGRRFSNLSKNNAVIIKHLRTTSPAQVLGASRYRYTGLYKVHVWVKAATETDAINNKFAIEQEIRRIIKTDVDALTSSGYDLIEIDDEFTEIETGNENAANTGIAGDVAIISRSVGTIKITYDINVTA